MSPGRSGLRSTSPDQVDATGQIRLASLAAAVLTRAHCSSLTDEVESGGGSTVKVAANGITSGQGSVIFSGVSATPREQFVKVLAFNPDAGAALILAHGDVDPG